MKLETITREQIQQVREWRNTELQFLRTSYMLTEDMQDEFFDNVINNRNSNHWYFAIMEGGQFVGMGGLTNIEWGNGCAEISLIINPDYRGQHKGEEAVEELLSKAFLDLRFESVYGEVYDCGNRGFWEKIVDSYDGYSVNLISRKFYNGKMYGSMWFSINKEFFI